MEKKFARITLDKDFQISRVDKRIYGSFIEHLGRAVYGGIYQPGHPSADEEGFRQDVLDLVREIGVPIVRYPGGNFVSNFYWEDSVGPVADRPRRLELAWRSTEPNLVGVNEFASWSKKAGSDVMMAVNLGTRGIEAACNLLEYCNHPSGTKYSDWRVSHGVEQPHNIKVWCLGNEMDGPWQIASWEKDPKGYGVLANETSKAMKWVDGSIETAVCGSSSPFMGHFPQWDLEVLQECYNAVDYVSLHHYHTAAPGNYFQLLGGAAYIEDYIETEAALCDFVQAKMRSPRKLMLSFDEYGAMMRPLQGIEHPGWGPYNLYHSHYRFDPNAAYVRHDPDNMVDNRRREVGDMVPALGSASILLAFLRHADRVKIGCMTSGLGALCATDREHVWRTASYYPFHQLMEYGRGQSLQVAVEGDTFDLPAYAVNDTSQYPAKEGLPYVDAAAAYDEKAGALTLFAINRDPAGDTQIQLDVSAFEGYRFVEHLELCAPDMDARNTWEAPDTIAPAVGQSAKEDQGVVTATLKPLSWNVLRFEK